ncbi:response regulator transcription factor [Porphyromonadaceae bacterium W3.11]|nr:response regulator transcription factor [Porphyromonadaceae bacterium W3.11]
MKKTKILLIDDTLYFGAEISAQLKDLGYEIMYMTNGVGLSRVLDEFRPDLVFMDIDLGIGQSGIDLCREVVKLYPALPVILISSSTDAKTRELGIRAGAQAFVGKPLTANLLEAYINLHLNKRREERYRAPEYSYDDLTALSTLKVSFSRGLIFYPNGEAMSISPIPTTILRMLLDNIGKEVTSEQLINKIWGEYSSISSTSSLYTAISSLRKALTPDRKIRLRTIRGIGYRLDVEV